VGDATAVEVAVVEAAIVAVVLDAVEEGVELAVSDGAIASVDVAFTESVRAATMPVLKVPTTMRLVRRTLAIENAITVFFIPT